MLESKLSERCRLLHSPLDYTGFPDDEPVRLSDAWESSVFVELSIHNDFTAADDLAPSQHTFRADR